MPELPLRLTLLSPAAIGDLRSSAFLTRTLRYVPGSVVRGALAQTWLIDHELAEGSDRRVFVALFEGDVSYGPLHKAGSLPDALSRVSHKYVPTNKCRKVLDAFDPSSRGEQCPVCKGVLETGKGSIQGVAVTVDNHAQLPRSPGEDPTLFSRERLDRGQVFVGVVGASAQEPLDRLRTLIGAGCEVWVGGRKSSGGGRARLEVADAPRPVPIVERDGRIDVMLSSPGLFVDDFGFPTDAPRPDELGELLGVGCTLERQVVRWTSVGGWHAASKLPKPVERAVAPGSVYRIKLSGGPPPGALDSLRSRGLGLRRAEGYGAVTGLPDISGRGDQFTRLTAPLMGLLAKPRGSLLLDAIIGDLRAREAGLEQWRRVPQPRLDALAKAPAEFAHAQEAVEGLKALGPEDLGRALDELERAKRRAAG